MKMNRQIDYKDFAEEFSFRIGLVLQETMNSIKDLSTKTMLKHSKQQEDWKTFQQRLFKTFARDTKAIIEEERKTLLNSIDEEIGALKLSSKQVNTIKSQINAGFKGLQSSAVNTYKQNVTYIDREMKIDVAGSLIQTISQRQLQYNGYGEVVYSNGRHVKWENWMEMNTRTTLQTYIADNMTRDGQANGVVFYICSYYGDCAKDHVQMQEQSIFYDEKWESICPEKYLDQVREWIDSHPNYLSVQDAMGEKGDYFTTRPNCRHYFQYISIEEVVGMSNKSDVRQYQQENDMYSGGKYKPEKYNVLQEQRKNERNIRKYKGMLESQERILATIPNDTAHATQYAQQMAVVNKLDKKVKEWQKANNKLCKNNPNLVRNYRREKHNTIISDFRVK